MAEDTKDSMFENAKKNRYYNVGRAWYNWNLDGFVHDREGIFDGKFKMEDNDYKYSPVMHKEMDLFGDRAITEKKDGELEWFAFANHGKGDDGKRIQSIYNTMLAPDFIDMDKLMPELREEQKALLVSIRSGTNPRIRKGSPGYGNLPRYTYSPLTKMGNLRFAKKIAPSILPINTAQICDAVINNRIGGSLLYYFSLFNEVEKALKSNDSDIRKYAEEISLIIKKQVSTFLKAYKLGHSKILDKITKNAKTPGGAVDLAKKGECIDRLESTVRTLTHAVAISPLFKTKIAVRKEDELKLTLTSEDESFELPEGTSVNLVELYNNLGVEVDNQNFSNLAKKERLADPDNILPDGVEPYLDEDKNGQRLFCDTFHDLRNFTSISLAMHPGYAQEHGKKISDEHFNAKLVKAFNDSNFSLEDFLEDYKTEYDEKVKEEYDAECKEREHQANKPNNSNRSITDNEDYSEQSYSSSDSDSPKPAQPSMPESVQPGRTVNEPQTTDPEDIQPTRRLRKKHRKPEDNDTSNRKETPETEQGSASAKMKQHLKRTPEHRDSTQQWYYKPISDQSPILGPFTSQVIRRKQRRYLESSYTPSTPSVVSVTSPVNIKTINTRTTFNLIDMVGNTSGMDLTY